MRRYAVPESTVVQRIDNEAVLINLNTGHYFGLDEIGLAMFDLIRDLGTADDVLNILRKDFDAPADQIASDLAEFIAKLEHSGLIVGA